MLGNPQNQEQNQNQSQNHQQQLQNNQLSQDSNALKHQFEKQIQKQEQVKNEFERKLFSNNNFLNKHQKLLKDGYTINSSDLNPVTNETGTFNIKYNNTNGKWATLQGNMKNGNAQINEQTQVEQEKLLENLKQNTQYLQFNSKLLKEGLSPSNTTFQTKANQTDIILKYVNNKNENASIVAQYVIDNLKQVTLKDGNSNQFNWNLLLILVVTIVSVFSIFLVINKINTNNRSVIDRSLKPRSNSFDYITESKKLMQEAIQQQNSGQYKAAFNTAGKSLRFFLTTDAAIKREATTQELTQLLQKNRYPLDDIRDCFKINDLVQFARYKPTDNDFKKIVSLIDKLTSFESSNEQPEKLEKNEV